MSDLSKALQQHAGATSILASILRTVLGTLPIQPNEKAGLMQSVQEVEDTANGLHKSFSTEAAEVGAAFVTGAETTEEEQATKPATEAPFAADRPIVQPIETRPSDTVETMKPDTETEAAVAKPMTAHQEAVAEELRAAKEAFEQAMANAKSVGVPT